jgi:hypothetical protein
MSVKFKGLGLLNPPPPAETVTPQQMHEYLKEEFGFDDTSMTYSNLWAQQMNGGNSWENFERYFNRMGLTSRTAEVHPPSPPPPPPPPSVPEYDTQLSDAIKNTFVTLLIRQPAKSELDQWYNSIKNGGANMSDLSVSITTSAEYIEKHPTGKEEKKTSLVPAIVAGAVAVGAVLLS